MLDQNNPPNKRLQKQSESRPECSKANACPNRSRYSSVNRRASVVALADGSKPAEKTRLRVIQCIVGVTPPSPEIPVQRALRTRCPKG